MHFKFIFFFINFFTQVFLPKFYHVIYKFKKAFLNFYRFIKQFKIIKIFRILPRRIFRRRFILWARFYKFIISSFESSSGLDFRRVFQIFFMSTFLLLCTKILFIIFFTIRVPTYINVLIYVFFLIVNYKVSPDIFFALRKGYISVLKVLLGKSFWYMHMRLDFYINWDHLCLPRSYYLRRRLREINHNYNIIHLFFRSCLCLCCYFELFRLSYPWTFFICNIVIHYFLIFNHAIYISLFISLILFISRFTVLLSDIYMITLKKNIKKVEHIEEDEYISVTLNNARILSLWITRSFDFGKHFKECILEADVDKLNTWPQRILRTFYYQFIRINLTRDKFRLFDDSGKLHYTVRVKTNRLKFIYWKDVPKFPIFEKKKVNSTLYVVRIIAFLHAIHKYDNKNNHH